MLCKKPKSKITSVAISQLVTQGEGIVGTIASPVKELVNLFSIGIVNKINGLKNVAITKKKKKSLIKNSTAT